ncbi:MAG: methyltransferase domain-containing protein [Acidobacteria bacterium]|nr:methyltransferase domain-containing protein [Acidobacteriota bacterium]
MNAAFDAQAGSFDRRAGLPAAAVEQIVSALREVCPDGLLLELGAGTGEIGSALIAAGARYTGLDLSLDMLGVFHGRTGRAALLQADADRPWPLRSGIARAVFASRAAHLFTPERLVDETLRVAHPAGAVFVLGRVRREGDSLRAILRRQMRRLLAGHGVAGRGGEEARSLLFSAFAARGGDPLPPRTAASWPVLERVADSLASWRSKPDLAGADVLPEVRHDVLERLAAWAEQTWGTLDFTREATESYELAAVRLPVSEETS